MPNSNGVKIEFTTNYLPDEDVTIIWQHIEVGEAFMQRSLVGWYYGEPDEQATEIYSIMPTTAQMF